MPLTESSTANANTRQWLTWISISKALPNSSFRKVRGWGTVFPLWMKVSGAFFKSHVGSHTSALGWPSLWLTEDCPCPTSRGFLCKAAHCPWAFEHFVCVRFKYWLLFLEMRTPQKHHLVYREDNILLHQSFPLKYSTKVWMFRTCLLAIYANLVYK